jgi:hypothetical protein
VIHFRRSKMREYEVRSDALEAPFPTRGVRLRRSMGMILIQALLWSAIVGPAATEPAAQAYNPRINPADFQTTIDNPWFPLVPGTTFIYREQIGGSKNENVVTVTSETKVIMGVTCVVVNDIVKEKDVIIEETTDWYAQDKEGNVWYFGEATKEYQARGKVITKGSWEAGVNGAKPGIIMKGNPVPGEPYRQEFLAGEAEDMGQVIAVNESVTVPYGKFTGCVKTKEWSMLEPGSENKWYARGVGNIKTKSSSNEEISVLMSITKQ